MSIVWGRIVGLRSFDDSLSDQEVERVYRWSRDTALLRLSGGTPTELTFKEFRDRLANDHANGFNNRRAFFVITREGELIGRIGCFAIDWLQKQGELGIVIGERDYWGRGYGRDAILTMLRHLFETTSLETINLFTYADNKRAQRCFAACGFRALGTARRFSPDVGEFEGIEMEITRREFLGQAAAKTHAYKIPVTQEPR